MAILRSTQIKGDLSVTGSLNVQGNLTYVGVENLRVKDKQIELNATDSGSAASAGANADEAGIVIRGARKSENVIDDASILYDYADDTLVVNKTIKGTVSNATTAAYADKVAQKLTVNVTNESGSKTTVEFDGSEAKTVDVNLKGLQDQINSLTGDAGSIKSQIDSAINALNSDVTATATGTAAKDGVFVLQSVKIDEKAGKLTSATPTAVEVEKAGAAAAVKTELIGKDSDTKDSATITGAKKYADSLNTAMDGRVDALEGASHTHANQAELDKIADGDVARWNAKQEALNTNQLNAVNSGVTAAKVSGYDEHVANKVIHITADERTAWNAKQNALNADQLNAVNSGITEAGVSKYEAHVADTTIHVTPEDKDKWNTIEQKANTYTDNEIKKLGSAAKKNVLTGAIADSSSEDLVTAAQVKEYAAGVVGAMHFRGAVTSTTEIENPASGDICLVGTKEYVYDGNNWVLFGDEGAYDTKGSATTAEQNAKTYADSLNTAMDTRVDALEAINHDAYKAADEATLASAKSYANELAATKADTEHTHKIADVTDLQATLDGKAAVGHNHDDVYSKIGHTHVVANITDLQDALDAKQDDLSADQLAAVDSGITAAKVSGYDSHIGNTDIHVSTADRTKWNAAEQNAKDYADGKVADLKKTVDSLSSDVLKSVVAAGDYVSVTPKSSNSQTISVTTKDVASASDTENGLALAADVKKYVDDKNALQDTKIANIENGKTLDSRYVNADGDTMTGELTMSATNIRMPENGTNGIIFGNMKIVWNSANGGAIEFIPA